MPEYSKVRVELEQLLSQKPFGNPAATTKAILALIDDKNPPLRLFLGKVAYPWVKSIYLERFEEWERWKDISTEAHG